MWRRTGALQSQPLRPGSEATTYETLYHTSLIVFDPSGHRFASTTDDKELVIVDPETGVVGPVLHDPIEAGAKGIIGARWAQDGHGVYVIAELTEGAGKSLYYATMEGPATTLAQLGEAVGFLPPPDGRQVLFNDGAALQLVGRDGSVSLVPYPAGVQPGSPIAWSPSGQRVLLYGTGDEKLPYLMTWDFDEAEARVLLINTVTGFGGPITTWAAVHSLMR